MSLSFRSVDADPRDPVETWPYEGLVAAIERGSVRDWARITAAIRADPWGDVARSVDHYLRYAERSGVTALLRRSVDRSRTESEQADRAIVASRVRDFIERSGLTGAQFAARLGTSPSRLSTYASGKVVPSAALVVRMERLAARRSVPPTPPPATEPSLC